MNQKLSLESDENYHASENSHLVRAMRIWNQNIFHRVVIGNGDIDGCVIVDNTKLIFYYG